MLEKEKITVKNLALTNYEIYLDNAKEQLKKAIKKDNIYTNVKYVRSASGTLYLGLLIIIEAIIEIKNENNLPKKYDIVEYRKMLGKHNKRWLNNINQAYNLLHLKGYYSIKGQPFTPKDWEESLSYVNYFLEELKLL